MEERTCVICYDDFDWDETKRQNCSTADWERKARTCSKRACKKEFVRRFKKDPEWFVHPSMRTTPKSPVEHEDWHGTGWYDPDEERERYEKVLAEETEEERYVRLREQKYERQEWAKALYPGGEPAETFSEYKQKVRDDRAAVLARYR